VRPLLDTHTFLWWIAGETLSGEATEAIAEETSEVLVSVASAWEIAIKRASGRLHAPVDLDAHLRRNAFSALSIAMDHARAAGALPPLHRDPFDRMLVAQARLEGLVLVTRDPQIGRYDVPVLAA